MWNLTKAATESNKTALTELNQLEESGEELRLK